jgi:hypothetical protein
MNNTSSYTQSSLGSQQSDNLTECNCLQAHDIEMAAL